MIEPKFEAAVGMSRKWDAREAGREVARDTIKKLDAPPKFFVLFSTIHYKKNGGFQELLNGVYDILPKYVPLIGGTVTGFSNNYGCYSRGVTALSVSFPKMDVALGFGKNTKRNPKKAAKQCAKMIKDRLKSSKYENKFLLNLISASEIPNIPPIGRKKIIREGLIIKIIMQLFGFSQYVFQKGAGRDDEVIREMIKYFPDFYMLGGGTLDDGTGFTNYQFINNKVLTNSVVTLGIKTQYNIGVLTTHCMKKTDVDFKITKMSKDGGIIHEINHKPAASELIRLLNWPDDFLKDDTWFKTNYYFPLGFPLDNSDRLGIRVVVGIFGESLITTLRTKESNVSILTIDGRNLMKSIDDNINSYKNKPEFGLIASCSTRLITLGDKIYLARDNLLNYFCESPFIEIYVGGESTYSPEKGLIYTNMSFNSAIFWKEQI
jgi:hypothetical protein